MLIAYQVLAQCFEGCMLALSLLISFVVHSINVEQQWEPVFWSFFGHRQKYFSNDRNKIYQFGHNV